MPAIACGKICPESLASTQYQKTLGTRATLAMKNLILIVTSFLLLTLPASAADDVKRADLAGSWYPGSRAELSTTIGQYLEQAAPEKVEGDIFAIIAPHAGYRFSGQVAAYAYKAAQEKPVKTVVLIGFNHKKYLNGISIYDRGSFETPLGIIDVDTELAAKIKAYSGRIVSEPSVFTDENSLEIQIPFIQEAFKGAKFVPLSFGTQNYRDAEVLAGALAATLKNRNDFIVVASTDLSHFHGYDEANVIDGRLMSVLSTMDAKKLFEETRSGSCEMCGIMPVTAVLLAAKEMGYDRIRVLKYANSGDAEGRKEEVVGYLSAAVYKSIDGRSSSVVSRPSSEEAKKNTEYGRRNTEDERRKTKDEKGESMLNEAQRKRLLQIARESITSYVRDGKKKKFTESDPVLSGEMGAFVTLHEAGKLRGCIGNMMARGPLYQTVADMAIEAATGDPRFRTLSPDETGKIDIEISVLSPLKRVASHNEIRVPGHGVLVKRGFASGVYLPQVATETGWSKEEFLTSLCGSKAGMAPDAWKDPETELYVFTAEVFGEKGEQK